MVFPGQPNTRPRLHRVITGGSTACDGKSEYEQLTFERKAADRNGGNSVRDAGVFAMPI